MLYRIILARYQTHSVCRPPADEECCNSAAIANKFGHTGHDSLGGGPRGTMSIVVA